MNPHVMAQREAEQQAALKRAQAEQSQALEFLDGRVVVTGGRVAADFAAEHTTADLRMLIMAIGLIEKNYEAVQ